MCDPQSGLTSATMPIVKPPRSLSAVRCVRKTRDKNGDVRYDLRVLFDYVMNIKNKHIIIWKIPNYLNIQKKLDNI